MLIYFLLDSGFIAGFPHPIPVDFHVLRILLANEILVWPSAPKGNYYRPKLRRVARRLLQTYCEQQTVDPRELCNAIWLYSRTCCRHHPGNRSRHGEYDGRNTVIDPTTIRWTATRQRTYDRNCGRCPIADTCYWHVPSAHYYVQGQIFPRGQRTTSPQGLLDFSLDPS